uniref:Ribosomal protein S7 n=1 Tax=Strombidium cf. sulcatum TaxID=2793073 RepID=A0A7T0M4L6_9SPIT|nr:ribosomal protein S7 [Strombidium cf. sulcatum]QPL15940.1 ribosomal protein S7 [Strombidium cf. sulcatum]
MMNYSSIYLQNVKSNILVNKDTVYHFVENRNYEIDKIYPILNTDEHQYYYHLWFNKNLNLFEEKSLFDSMTTKYGRGDSKNKFSYLSRNSFILFFKENNIDTPICFQDSNSLKRKINEVELLKFNNYLMKDGKRWQFFNTFLNVNMGIYYNHKFFTTRNNNQYNWKSIFYYYKFITYSTSSYSNFSSINFSKLNFNTTLRNYEKSYDYNFTLKNFLYKNIFKLLPTFVYYVYKVSKQIYKNTRGKSGKNTFIWKYVSPYKRIFLVKHWLMKEVKFRPGKTLTSRLGSVFTDLINNHTNLRIYKIKRFSHAYVYKYSKHTLGETYQTVTK